MFVSHELLLFIMLIFFFLLFPSVLGSSYYSPTGESTPTYYVDPYILQLTQTRLQKCLFTYPLYSSSESSSPSNKKYTVLSELQYITSTQPYESYIHGSHELLAYHYFVEGIPLDANANYRDDITQAELEYLPILSLHWRTNQPGCGFSSFITMLLKIHSYLLERDASLLESIHKHKRVTKAMKEVNQSLPLQFFVSSTFNMRTMWGTGMPTPYRRGSAWENISALTQRLNVGHYERYPECPDLLRKWWRYAVELPMLPYTPSLLSNPTLHVLNLHPEDSEIMTSFSVPSNHRRGHSVVNITTFTSRLRTQRHAELQQHPERAALPANKHFIFYFAGHFELPGPELVCSTRNSILQLSHRSDLLVHNVSNTFKHSSPLRAELSLFLDASLFCLITPGESYSTSLLFNAIANDCIPVVINDWMVFPFPWLIPYESFVIRIREADFAQDAEFVLDELKRLFLYEKKGLALLLAMRRAMRQLKELLAFEKVELHSEKYRNLILFGDKYLKIKPLRAVAETGTGTGAAVAQRDGVEGDERKRYTVLPWELLMLELKYSVAPQMFYANIPCTRPLWCENFPLTSPIRAPETGHHTERETHTAAGAAVSAATTQRNAFMSISMIKDKLLRFNMQLEDSIDPGEGEVVIELFSEGFQANGIKFDMKSRTDKRSHLCVHKMRLIGIYKIVYYMQCVRVLWTLTPGKFKPKDNIARFSLGQNNPENSNMVVGEAKTKAKTKNQDKGKDEGISFEDYEFVLAFHNASRPANWKWHLKNYPVPDDLSRVVRMEENVL